MAIEELYIKGPSQQLTGQTVLGTTQFYDNRISEKLVKHPSMTNAALEKFKLLEDLPEYPHEVIKLRVEIVGSEITDAVSYTHLTLPTTPYV